MGILYFKKYRKIAFVVEGANKAYIYEDF